MGAYAFVKFKTSSWNKVEFSKFSGLPSILSTTRSFVIWNCASEGLKRYSLGLIILTSSPYKDLNNSSKDWSVPLLR